MSRSETTATTTLELTQPVRITPFLLDYFLASVVRDQFGGGRHVVRWPSTGTVAVAVTGAPTAQDQRVLKETLRTYGAITPFTLVRASPGQITMHFAPKTEWAAILDDPTVDLGPAGWTYTFSRGTTDRPGTAAELTEARVVIDSTAPQAARDRVIAHELGHAMGLGHGDCQNSLMYDGPAARPLWSPTALDQTMLELLYDRRLEPGMDEAEVRAQLTPNASNGPVCGKVAWQLVEHESVAYYCRVGSASQPCIRYRGIEPSFPVTRPDAWVLDGLIADYDPSLWVEYRFAGHRLLCEKTHEAARPCVIFQGGTQPSYPVTRADYWTNGVFVYRHKPT